MTDFLSNLLLRNIADPSATTILRPRLPSLFEPLQRTDQVGSPLEEPFPQEPLPPDNRSSTEGIRPAGEPNVPPTVIPGQALRRISGATDPSINSKAMKRIQTSETAMDTGDQSHAVRPVSSYQGPQRPMFYRDPEDAFARQKPPSHENHFSSSDESEKGLRTESNLSRVQAVGENPLPAKLTARPFETKTAPLKEKDTIVDKVPSQIEPLQIRASLKPITSSSAIPTDSYPMGRKESTSPPAVEIHIGRVEVRAVPAAPKAKPASQPNPPRLSLDDYLRSRSGEKQ